MNGAGHDPVVSPEDSWLARWERRAPDWFRGVPLLLICVLLILLVVVPVDMGRRREELRRQIADEVSPAQAALNESEAAFAYEVAVYRGYLATGDSAWLGQLWASHQGQERAMRKLALRASRVGPSMRPRLERLETRKQAWLASPLDLLAGHATREGLVRGLPHSEAQFQAVLAASEDMNLALLRVDRGLHAEFRANAARERWIVALLALGAFLVALTTGWLSFRLARITRALEKERWREARARATAEDAVRTRDQVLRVVSHDLKNPLHTIGMVAQLLATIPMSEEDRAEKLAIIQRTVDHAHHLVLDLLDIARLQAEGTLPVTPSPTPCAGLVRDAVETADVQAAEKEIHLTSRIDSRCAEVMADRARVLQVFANLLGNAVKFTPPGGHVEVDAGPDGDGMIRFRVTDSGPGVPAHDLPNLFEPFWQARATASLGTGLGLTIAKAITEAHGGAISVDSVPGRTCFSFTLPLASSTDGASDLE